MNGELELRDRLEKAKRLAPVIAYLMTPVAVTGYALALWRLGADLNWTGQFFIDKGLLSRWQVWLAIGVATQIAAQQLNRRPERSAAARETGA